MSRNRSHSSHIPALDGVRGAAILAVLSVHWLSKPPPGSLSAYAAPLTRLGWTGVDLFFVLSGFLIARLLWQNVNSPHYYQTFYLRRAHRILPLYLLVLGVCVAVNLLRGPVRPFEMNLPWWKYFAQMQNIGYAFWSWADRGLIPTWSLAAEEYFYLVLPALIRFVPFARWPVLLPVLLAAGLAGRWLMLSYVPQFAAHANYLVFPLHADGLWLGVGVAWVYTRYGGVIPTHMVRYAGAACLVGLSYVVFALVSGESNAIRPITARYGYLCLSLGHAGLVTLILNRNPLLSQVFGWAWLRWIGTVSFGVYLLHEFVMGVNGRILPSLLITLALAAVCYRWLEAPMIRLGQRYRY